MFDAQKLVSTPLIQTLYIFKVGPIGDFVQFGILSIRDYFHSGFFPLRNFVQFGISYDLDFVQFGILSIRDFFHSGFCPVRNFV